MRGHVSPYRLRGARPGWSSVDTTWALGRGLGSESVALPVARTTYAGCRLRRERSSVGEKVLRRAVQDPRVRYPFCSPRGGLLESRRANRAKLVPLTRFSRGFAFG